MGLHKISKIVALVLGVAGVLLWGMLMIKGDEAVMLVLIRNKYKKVYLFLIRG